MHIFFIVKVENICIFKPCMLDEEKKGKVLLLVKYFTLTALEELEEDSPLQVKVLHTCIRKQEIQWI